MDLKKLEETVIDVSSKMEAEGMDSEYRLVRDTEYDYYDDRYKEDFGIDDCYLVRTTDIFPVNGIVQTPLNANACGFSKSNIFEKYLDDKLPLVSKDYNKEKEDYYVCFEVLRSTIHFAINGVVGDHSQGKFSGKPYVIIEPLKEHIDDTLVSLWSSDTYFNDDMYLTDKCTLLIDKDIYDMYKDNDEFIEQLNSVNFECRLFKGDAALATKELFEEKGRYYFSISAHGFTRGQESRAKASEMNNFLRSYVAQNNLSEIPHYYSELNKNEQQIRIDKGFEIEKKHLNYILDSIGDDELRNKFSDELLEYQFQTWTTPKELYDACDCLFKTIGFEKFKELTKKFNEEYIANLKSSSQAKRR